MSAHTPGPWVAMPPYNERNGHMLFWTVAPAADPDIHLATVNGAADEGVDMATVAADARLIAAAPDLLHACRLARELCDVAGFDAIKRLIVAAIDKAEGSKP